MLRNKQSSGFSLVEIMVTLVLIGIFSTIFLTVFKSTIFNYLDLQKQASSFNQLSRQADRVANVLRGATKVDTAKDNDLTVYAYFYPSDSYVSQVRYFVAVNQGRRQLMADLTPMTANPPVGTLDTSKKKTITIIDSLYQPTNGKLFTYLNAESTTLSTPVNDVSVVKSIQINLSSSLDNGASQTMDLRVVLRNKKNNL